MAKLAPQHKNLIQNKQGMIDLDFREDGVTVFMMTGNERLQVMKLNMDEARALEEALIDFFRNTEFGA